jgi:hypothetical protein
MIESKHTRIHVAVRSEIVIYVKDAYTLKAK